jgi:hypothetical protein
VERCIVRVYLEKFMILTHRARGVVIAGLWDMGLVVHLLSLSPLLYGCVISGKAFNHLGLLPHLKNEINITYCIVLL